MFNSSEECTFSRLFRMLVEHVPTLGAMPQPDDPFDALSLAVLGGVSYEREKGKTAI